jgi:arylsulfatase A-like enzyme
LSISTKALKQCGYNTEMVGKWHLGFFRSDYCPQNRGFDHFMGFYTGSEDYYTHTKCFSGMCGYDFREAYSPAQRKPEVIRYDLNDTYSSGAFAENLHSRLEILDPEVPLFTYVSFQAVHSPLQAPQKYIDIYRNMKNRKRRNYNAMVTAMDKSINQIVKSYKKFGFWDNTARVFE